MALIKKFDIEESQNTSIHEPVHRATFRKFSKENGATYLQMTTYGRSSREQPEKASQSIQLSPEAIAQLKEILAGV